MDPLAAHPPLRSLLDAFERADIAPAAWTHREHVEVAAAILALEPLDAAIDRFRSGLLRLNAAHGVPQTDVGGYHETLTQAFLRLIDAHLRALPAGTPLPERLASVSAAFADKYVVLRYFSRERVMSPAARYGWVAPDLRGIPGMPFVRAAGPDDDATIADAVAALHDELRAFEPTVRPGAEVAGYAAGLREACGVTGGEVFVATVDDAIIGFAAVRLERAPEARWNAAGDVAYLSDMRVDPAWRGRGVGKLLVERVEALARAAGAAQLRLMVMAGDEASRAFYARAGFADLRAIMQRPL